MAHLRGKNYLQALNWNFLSQNTNGKNCAPKFKLYLNEDVEMVSEYVQRSPVGLYVQGSKVCACS